MKSLVEKIVEFTEILRLAGVRTSLAETIDAVCALEHINLLSKEQVNIALATCLAKSEDERRIFNEAFEKFFIHESARSQWIQDKIADLEQKKAQIIEQAEEVKFQGEEIELTDELKEVYAQLTVDEKHSILDFLDKTSMGKNVTQNFKPIVENLVRSKLDKLRHDKDRGVGADSGIFSKTASEAGMIAEEVIKAVRNEKSLFHKNLGDIKDEDVPRVIHLIRQVTARIKRENSRRYKNIGKRARLDIKKTIRSNLSTGGALFRLEYKKRVRRKNQFLVLCDVSASMYRFSGFILQFIMGMQSGAAKTDCFIFSQQLERINMQNISSMDGYEKYIKESNVWRKGTNIGKVLDEFLEDETRILKSSTVVIIVSDAKTLEVDKAVKKLGKIQSKVKRILWLNPLQEKEWDRIPGIKQITDYCKMMDCSTLERLENVCRIF